MVNRHLKYWSANKVTDYGGHRLWTTLENPFYTYPEEGLDIFESNGKVVLKSPVDVTGLEKEIKIRLDANQIHLSHKILWHSDAVLHEGIWEVFTDEYPATLESARKIKKQLSQPTKNGE